MWIWHTVIVSHGYVIVCLDESTLIRPVVFTITRLRLRQEFWGYVLLQFQSKLATDVWQQLSATNTYCTAKVVMWADVRHAFAVYICLFLVAATRFFTDFYWLLKERNSTHKKPSSNNYSKKVKYSLSQIRPQGNDDLQFHNLQPDTRLHCETIDIVHRMSCLLNLFTPSLCL